MVEIDTGRSELPEERHQVLEGAPEPVNALSCDHVELAPRCAFEHAVEGWGACPGPWHH